MIKKMIHKELSSKKSAKNCCFDWKREKNMLINNLFKIYEFGDDFFLAHFSFCMFSDKV